MKLIFRPLLVSGMLGADAEGHVMLIDNEQSEIEQVRAIWHETAHLLLQAAGSPFVHDEVYIEQLAHSLASATPSDFLRKLKPSFRVTIDEKLPEGMFLLKPGEEPLRVNMKLGYTKHGQCAALGCALERRGDGAACDEAQRCGMLPEKT